MFDAEAALADATGILAAAYDSGDGLHPNDAGMAAIAGAVDVDTLIGRVCRGGGRGNGLFASRAPSACARPARLPALGGR